MKKKKSKNYFKLFGKIKIEYGFLITLLCTAVLFFAYFAIINNYPFSDITYNGADFDSGYVPTYYKLWDILHFKSSPFFDWNLGLGLNVLGSMIGNGFLSPLCWLIAIFPRSFIPKALTYIYLFKILFMSGICYFSISKIFPKTEQKYKVIFTLMYSFSSYILLMFSSILYIDSIALFPLLVYGLKELLENEKWKVFFITLVLILIFSYYMAWMCLFFIIGASSIYLLVMKTERKKEKFIKVILLSIFSLAVGAFSFVPGFMLAMTSYRMSTNTSSDTGFDIYLCLLKALHLISLAIPFALFTKQLFVKKDKRINIFFGLLMIYLLIGIFIEPINALWHTGSHSGLVFREGYIPTFSLILISLYYLNNNKKYNDKFNIFSIIPEGLLFIIYIIYLDLILNIYKTITPYYSNYLNSISYFCYPAILFVIIYIMIMLSNNFNKKMFYGLIVVMFILNTIPLMSILNENDLYIAPTSSYTENVINDLDLTKDNYNYKTISDSTFNLNWPYIANLPSMDNRLHFIKKSEIDFSSYFNYYKFDTKIYSKGGNVFTDLLLQNKHVISLYELPDVLYELKEKKNNLYYYDAKYNLNYLVPYNYSDIEFTGNDGFENSNLVYKKYFNREDNLFEKIDYTVSDNKYTFNTKKGDNYVYYALVNFDINGDTYSFNFGTDLKSYYFYDNDVLYLCLSNINSNKFSITFDFDIFDIKMYRLDVNKYKEFVNDINTLDVKVNTKGTTRTYDVVSDKDQSVIIPINYDDCFKIYVNGKEVDYKLAFVNYISVDITKGNNKIEIKYSNKWFKIGIITTIVSIIFLIILCLINKKIDLLKFKFIKWPWFIICLLFVIFFFLKVYILSWI